MVRVAALRGLSARLRPAAAALLLVFHPGAVAGGGCRARRNSAGPSFFICSAAALYDLRARSGVSEVMAVGLASGRPRLLASDGRGARLRGDPFLIFAVRPALAANSAINVVLTLVFPTIFAAASFAYVSWVFPGSGWSFLVAPAEGVSTWTAAFTRGSWRRPDRRDRRSTPAIATALALVLGAPVAGLAMRTGVPASSARRAGAGAMRRDRRGGMPGGRDRTVRRSGGADGGAPVLAARGPSSACPMRAAGDAS